MAIGLIYSIATGRLRRVIIPDNDAQLSSMTGTGESLLSITPSQYQSSTDQQAIVNSHTGLTPSGDRYVSVDGSNNVLSVHIADPACGDIAPQAGATLTLHATAIIGDLLWSGKLLPNQPVTALAVVLGAFGHLNRVARNLPLP